MQTKQNIAVLFGGRSAEHEISLVSARNIMNGLDRSRYDVVPVGIDKTGRWFAAEQPEAIIVDREGRQLPELNPAGGRELGFSPGSGRNALFFRDDGRSLEIDAVVPVLHGPFGEDGSLQGLLKLLDVPYTGPDTLGSSVGMDKDVMKRLFRDAGIPNARFRVYQRGEAEQLGDDEFQEIIKELGTPVYVKPANMGSSVGVSRAEDAAAVRAAVTEALLYDDKVVLEEAIVGREIECAVLGNEEPRASQVIGEIIPKAGGFYSYDAKYLDESGAALELPAKLSAAEVELAREMSIRTYRALCLEGLTRVDMFLTPNGTIYVNEVNTMPGFTHISMYPKLWELSGLPLPDLLDELIQLAVQRHRRAAKLKVDA